MDAGEGRSGVRTKPEELEGLLKALGNANRIRLLQALQTPKGYADLDLPPTREDAHGRQDRAITRQALRRHLQELVDIGVVQQRPPGPDGQNLFLVDHARIYGVVEQLRELATVRPAAELSTPTIGLTGKVLPRGAEGPRLVLVRGVHEGKPFPLDGAKREWSIGRDRASEVCLDYDPFVSASHARIEQARGGFALMDLPINKNGTELNWQTLPKGGRAKLLPGDVIGVGTTLLVFRE